MRDFRHLFQAGVGLLALGCAASSSGSATQGAGPGGAAPNVARAAPAAASSSRANLGGARCDVGAGVCTCRNGAGEPAETSPPEEGHKRFEIRLGAGDGAATWSSPTLGELSSGRGESCFYVDVVPGTTHEVSFVASEARPEEGVAPVLEVNEYGPKGPWWYAVVDVKCPGPGGHCNRDGADAWSAELKTRKRGRIDPCGSAVIKNLKWDTTGGTGLRELGLFADFKVSFTLEVKKFPTQFKPGSTECVPK
jgi:hypothetical protein